MLRLHIEIKFRKWGFTLGTFKQDFEFAGTIPVPVTLANNNGVLITVKSVQGA